ncbi:MAG: RIP metalloprotease RseP [Candidatus Cloacimonadales bacterium]
MSIVIAILALGLLVLIHEGGHFLAARLCKVSVLKFSIGFGPKIFSFVKNGTEYALSLIPLGGYVKMKGDEPEDSDEEQDTFNSKTWYQRAFIALAGPLANLIFAFLLFIFALLVGKTYKDFTPEIYQAKGVYSQFLRTEDKILEVNEQKVVTWTDIFKYTIENQENTFNISNNEENRTEIIKTTTLQDFYNNLLPVSSTVIGEVSSGLPAWKAGLKEGDKILKIQEIDVNTWNEVRDLIVKADSEISLLIERDDKQLNVRVLPEENPLELGSYIIGISQELPLEIHEKSNLVDAIKYGSINTVGFVGMNYYALYKLVKNPRMFKNSIGGPVMVFSMTKESSEKGFADTLNFIAAISLLLMIMNLLPVPILDGGHIAFCLIEGIMRRKVSFKVQQYAQQVGFVLLMVLMLYAFANDFTKLASRAHSIKGMNEEVSSD